MGDVELGPLQMRLILQLFKQRCGLSSNWYVKDQGRALSGAQEHPHPCHQTKEDQQVCGCPASSYKGVP